MSSINLYRFIPYEKWKKLLMMKKYVLIITRNNISKLFRYLYIFEEISMEI